MKVKEREEIEEDKEGWELEVEKGVLMAWQKPWFASGYFDKF